MTVDWIGLGGRALTCATNTAALAGRMDASISAAASISGSQRETKSASTSATRLRPSAMPLVIGHADSNSPAALHTVEKTGEERNVHSAPARYAAGAMRAADKRPRPPSRTGDRS